MLVVGLTGGIGSGKSSAAHCFAELGVPVIDADVIARELVAPGQPALQAIVEAFGGSVLNDDGALDRAQLRRLIFSNAAERKKLEGILHPPLRAAMDERIAQLPDPYCIACVPLLLETGQAQRVQRVLVVDTPHYLQYRRVMARDGSSAAEVAAILRAQINSRRRLLLADDVIVNAGDLPNLQIQIERLHHYYQKLATQGLPVLHK